MSNLKRFANNYNWSGLEYPAAINKIIEFEKKNGIAVNVLGVRLNKFFPLRISKYESGKKSLTYY